MGLGRTLGSFAVGLAVSPALDYAWHAWIAHGRGSDPSRAAHLEHHRTAHTEGDAWAEIRENRGRVARDAAIVAAVLAPLIGPSRSIPLAAGLGAAYVGITLSHARMHVRGPRGAWEEWMWRFHFHHHYVDSKVNFGLTSPLFDYVFGTAVAPCEVTIPEGSLPSWWDGERAGFRVRRARGARAATVE